MHIVISLIFTLIWYILNKKRTGRLAYAKEQDEIVNKNIQENKKTMQGVKAIVQPQATSLGQACL